MAKAQESRGKYAFKSHAEVARWIGLSKKTVDGWAADGMPGMGSDGFYDLQEIIRWLVRRRKIHVVDPTLIPFSDPASKDDPEFGVDWLSQKRMYEAKQAQIDFAERLRESIPSAEMAIVLRSMASHIRGLGEQLERRFGDDALDMLNLAVDEFEIELEQLVVDSENQEN